MTETDVLAVSAVVFRDGDGRVLTVRKRGTELFMLPGGKPEPGEDAAAAAARECGEELGIELEPGALVPLGVFRTPAANEPDTDIVATVFGSDARPDARPLAEIAEARWLDVAHPLPADLAPLLIDAVLPALARA